MATPLSYEEWEPYAAPYPEGMPEDAKDVLAKHRRVMAERRIRLVNGMLDELMELWPEGNALCFCIALELHNSNEEEILEHLKDPEFIAKVVAEADARGVAIKGKSDAAASSVEEEHSYADLDSSSDSDSDSDSSDDGHGKRRVRKWSHTDVENFKLIVREAAQQSGQRVITSWKAIARRFPGRTKEQCLNLYHRLRQQRQLDVVFRQRKSENKLGRPTRVMQEERDRSRSLQKSVRHIVGIRFLFKKMDVWVGPSSEKLREVAATNPVANYIDAITLQKIMYPAISPDFYLLDYTTWCRLLKKDQENPFTRQRMNKRQLEFLTPENIHEYMYKIVNLQESRPDDPADDSLREYFEDAAIDRPAEPETSG